MTCRAARHARALGKAKERLMEEAKKSGAAAGAAKSRTRPVVDPAMRTFVAVSLQRTLARNSSRIVPDWNKTRPEEEKEYFQGLNDSLRVWKVRELADFRGVELPAKFTSQDTRRLLKELVRPDSEVKDIKPTIQRTPEALKEAQRQLTIRTFGARLLRGRLKGGPGWLKLSPEVRQHANQNFDSALQAWAGNQNSLSNRIRQLSVQTWVEHRAKSTVSQGADRKNTAATRKDTAQEL